MHSKKSPLPSLPLMKVQENLERRGSPRLCPRGMMGMVRFTNQNHTTAEVFVGLNLSQTGAAILIAPGDERDFSKGGELSIYLQQTAFHYIPFRVAHSKPYDNLLLVGVEFKNRVIPLEAVVGS